MPRSRAGAAPLVKVSSPLVGSAHHGVPRRFCRVYRALPRSRELSGAPLDPPGAAPSPQATAEPAPLASTTGGGPAATALGGDGGAVPEPLQHDRALPVDTPHEPGSKDSAKETRALGVRAPSAHSQRGRARAAARLGGQRSGDRFGEAKGRGAPHDLRLADASARRPLRRLRGPSGYRASFPHRSIWPPPSAGLAKARIASPSPARSGPFSANADSTWRPSPARGGSPRWRGPAPPQHADASRGRFDTGGKGHPRARHL